MKKNVKNTKNLICIVVALIIIGLIIGGILLFSKDKEETKNNYIAYIRINPLIKIEYSQTCKIEKCNDPIVTKYELINDDAKDIYKDIDLIGTNNNLYDVITLISKTAEENNIEFENVEIYSNWDNLNDYIDNFNKDNYKWSYIINIRDKEKLEDISSSLEQNKEENIKLKLVAKNEYINGIFRNKLEVIDITSLYNLNEYKIDLTSLYGTYDSEQDLENKLLKVLNDTAIDVNHIVKSNIKYGKEEAIEGRQFITNKYWEAEFEFVKIDKDKYVNYDINLNDITGVSYAIGEAEVNLISPDCLGKKPSQLTHLCTSDVFIENSSYDGEYLYSGCSKCIISPTQDIVDMLNKEKGLSAYIENGVLKVQTLTFGEFSKYKKFNKYKGEYILDDKGVLYKNLEVNNNTIVSINTQYERITSNICEEFHLSCTKW